MQDREFYKMDCCEPGEHPCRICAHVERFHYRWMEKAPKAFEGAWICDPCVNPSWETEYLKLSRQELIATFHQYEPSATIRECRPLPKLTGVDLDKLPDRITFFID